MTADVQPDGVAGQPPDRYVAQMLTRLYPPPLSVRPGRGSKPADSRVRFLLLPSPRLPRIVVPAGHRSAGARAVHRQLTGRRPRTRVARWALTLALRSGLVDLLSPYRMAVRGPAGADSIDRLLAGVLGVETVLVVMPVGPARANRKPVLQVTDSTGAVLAFVKIGHDDLTRALVRAEGRALERLADAGLRHTRVPGVLAHLDWRGLVVLVLEPLPVVAPPLAGSRARDALLATVREIAGLSSWQGDWSSNPFRCRLEAELTGCGARATRLVETLDEIDAAAPRVALGSWHGDLNPGNVAVQPDQVLVWDWERFDDRVPIGFDLLHHEMQHAITVQGVHPRTAACRLLGSAPELLAELQVDPPTARTTARLYLLALAGRYLRDDQARAGAALGRVEEWIVPVLRVTPPAE